MEDLNSTVLLAGILGGLAITVLGALAMLSLGLSRRLRHEVIEHQAALAQLGAANGELQRRLEEIHALQQRLQEQAIRDSLTGLHNRRYLDETLPRELARAKREGYPLALIMVDIDHFKHINDTYGHPAGDEVIRRLGALLHAGTREGDVACRYGGEEFVIALPRMALADALVRAEQWRQAARDTEVRHGELPIRFSLSAGVAAFPEHAAEFDTLTECADLALYLSKKGGRDRVTAYEATEAPC